MKNKKIALVDLMGGFGNQLFQFSYAKYLEDAGFETYINQFNLIRNKYKKNSIITKRELLLPISFFEFKEISKLSFIKYDLIDKLKIDKLSLLNKSSKFKEYFSWINESNKNKSTYAKYNRFTGYWQDVDIFYKNKDFILKSISKDKTINKTLTQEKAKGSTALHIRRKDYITLGEDLSINFFINCINYCEKNIADFNYEIFSDDQEWVKKQSIFKNAKKIHKFVDSKENTLRSFAELMVCENFIVGNSSFSLTAAMLGSTEKSKILVANPWFKNNPNQTNENKNFIQIDNV